MNFEMKHFFALGQVIFLIVMICSIISIVANWEYTALQNKVSSIAMCFFYGIITLVFRKNYKDLAKTPTISEADIDEAIRDIKEFE